MMMRATDLARDYFDGLLHLFYPENCGACGAALGAGEPLFCMACEADMPETGYHRVEAWQNPALRRFWGRVDMQGVWACWYLGSAGPVRELLHRLKYRGRPDLARDCGRYFAEQLRLDGKADDLDGLAYVPMDRAKEAVRGYNPAREIAAGMSEVLELPLRNDLLRRLPGGKTQTHKDRFERWESVRRLYGGGGGLPTVPGPAAQDAERAHLVLVDDVMTTGATLEACALLLQQGGFRVTAAVLAAAL
jgi:predicted amidophosphoribosyltransferase